LATARVFVLLSGQARTGGPRRTVARATGPAPSVPNAEPDIAAANEANLGLEPDPALLLTTPVAGSRRSSRARREVDMVITRIRERVSARLLRTGTELAIDQRELEERMAATAGAAGRSAAYSSAYGAVAMARWVDSAVLWLAWRIHPRTFTPAP
jgi:hypothetical protein